MRRQYASMVFVNVMWGLSFIASKHALNAGFAPMTLALARYVMASLILLPALLRRGKRLTLRRRDVPPMILSALMGITFYYFFEYNGISRTSTVSASLILAAIPVMTMAAQAATCRRALRPAQVAGALISLGGVALIVLSAGDDGQASLLGDLLILGAAATWVLDIFISRKLREEYSSLAMNTWQALIAAATLAPLALAEKCDVRAVPWDGWAAVLMLAAICSALCYFLYGNALSAMSPLASAIFINLIPLTTIVGGVLLLGERLTWQILLGGGLIVGSIFLVNLSSEPA